MELKELHKLISDKIAILDFDKIWPGFRPLKFALYNDTECFFDGSYIEKTADFCANTSIVYNGETIAIWKVQGDLDINVLASKMVHEMFHGYQNQNHWDCFPPEMEALYKYNYDVKNLSIKKRENELLLELAGHFDRDRYEKVLAYRKYRKKQFPYEYDYEVRGEEIEGTANYVEWMVLGQLAPQRAEALVREMREEMANPKYYMPIRISCYYTGALMINAAVQAGDYVYNASERPFGLTMLSNAATDPAPINGDEIIDRSMDDAICAFKAATRSIIEDAVKRNEIVLEGPYELMSVNIYDAKCLDGFVTSRFFVMYVDNGENKLIQGDFVVKLDEDGRIERVYRATL